MSRQVCVPLIYIPPFPEEFNRELTTRITQFNFAPTEKARQNLRNEQVHDEQIVVMGNTVIDALLPVFEKASALNYSADL